MLGTAADVRGGGGGAGGGGGGGCSVGGTDVADDILGGGAGGRAIGGVMAAGRAIGGVGGMAGTVGRCDKPGGRGGPPWPIGPADTVGVDVVAGRGGNIAGRPWGVFNGAAGVAERAIGGAGGRETGGAAGGGGASVTAGGAGGAGG
jgi:hypothetical protein